MSLSNMLKDAVIKQIEQKMKPLQEKDILTKEEASELEKYKEAIDKVRNTK